MKIQMVDLQSQYNSIREEVNNAIQEVIDSSVFINGEEVQKFTSELASYLGVKHVQTCANGTDALQIALMALDLSPGDEVLIPSFTYVAPAEVVVLLGLKPVFVDVNPKNYNIDVADLRKKINSKSRVVIPVHLYGQCADMDPIIELAKEFELYVIEDTAQSLGSDYNCFSGDRRKAGTIGHIGTTSFFPSKNLGCFGDGGAIITNDTELAEKCRLAANHGQRKKYHHDVIGCNSRLDTLQAAILRVKLKQLDYYISQRQKISTAYNAAFKNLSHITCPHLETYSTHSFHQYTIKSKLRDQIKIKILERGIPSMIYYPVPAHHQVALRSFSSAQLTVSENLCKEVLSLPIHTEMTDEQLNFIIENFIQVVNEI